MLSRDDPSLQDPRAGLPTHPGGVAERPMVGRRVSCDDGGFWVEVWLPTA
jgi:hypothetical protein